MKADKARSITCRVIRKRNEDERKSREGIETDMDELYAWIKEQAESGQKSALWQRGRFSLQAEQELLKNGFKIRKVPAMGGYMFSIEWW